MHGRTYGWHWLQQEASRAEPMGTATQNHQKLRRLETVQTQPRVSCLIMGIELRQPWPRQSNRHCLSYRQSSIPWKGWPTSSIWL